jgi:hypothetical protein
MDGPMRRAFAGFPPDPNLPQDRVDNLTQFRPLNRPKKKAKRDVNAQRGHNQRDNRNQ